MGQVKNQFDKESLKKICKGALIGMLGFIAGEGGIQITQYLSQAELGIYRPFAVVVGGILINIVREYVRGHYNES